MNAAQRAYVSTGVAAVWKDWAGHSDDHEIRLQSAPWVHDVVKIIAAMRLEAEPQEADSFRVASNSGTIVDPSQMAMLDKQRFSDALRRL